jgi:HD-GYP domain-containing protein (c-di-GMP phosphodiesterase class II)
LAGDAELVARELRRAGFDPFWKRVETAEALSAALAERTWDIVTKADFPPVIADMVLHHHEWMDGSGYPDGLKSDEIGLEARCLAVADVVEAMSSNRPYRPAAGIDSALEEIARNKGTYYDERIVDACVRLFKEKGFAF